MQSNCTFLLAGIYDINKITYATQNKYAACSTILQAKTKKSIVQLVFNMIADLGFTIEYVDLILDEFRTKSVDEFTFTNLDEQVISASQISLAQLLMIRLYTSPQQSETCKRNLSQMLKEALRDRKAEDVTKLGGVITTLDNALESLPRYVSEDALFRGEKVSIKCLQAGYQFHLVYFGSFSLDVYEALDFTNNQTCTLFVLRNPKSGADIAFASSVKMEMEVLYPRNTHFQVLRVFTGAEAIDYVPELKKVKISDQLTVIEIAEAPTQAPGP